jgi:hypothetical protein
MRQLRSEGLGVDRIAAQLNAENRPARKPGKQWFGNAVRRILANTAD